MSCLEPEENLQKSDSLPFSTMSVIQSHGSTGLHKLFLGVTLLNVVGNLTAVSWRVKH